MDTFLMISSQFPFPNIRLTMTSLGLFLQSNAQKQRGFEERKGNYWGSFFMRSNIGDQEDSEVGVSPVSIDDFSQQLNKEPLSSS